jgi:hypothetical protein
VDGLQILSFDARKCWCDPKVVEFYKHGITKLTPEICSSRRHQQKRQQKDPENTDPIRNTFMTDWISKTNAQDANDEQLNFPATQFEDNIEDFEIFFDQLPPIEPLIPQYCVPLAFTAKTADIPPLPSWL